MSTTGATRMAIQSDPGGNAGTGRKIEASAASASRQIRRSETNCSREDSTVGAVTAGSLGRIVSTKVRRAVSPYRVVFGAELVGRPRSRAGSGGSLLPVSDGEPLPEPSRSRADQTVALDTLR